MLKYSMQLTDYTNNKSNETKIVVTNVDDSDNTWYYSPNEKRFMLVIEDESRSITLPIRLTLSVSEMQKALDAIKAVESW